MQYYIINMKDSSFWLMSWLLTCKFQPKCPYPTTPILSREDSAAMSCTQTIKHADKNLKPANDLLYISSSPISFSLERHSQHLLLHLPDNPTRLQITASPPHKHSSQLLSSRNCRKSTVQSLTGTGHG